MKKFFTIFLIIAYLFSMIIPVSAISSLESVQPSGTGTEADPYIIAEAGNLVWVRNNNNSYSGFSGKYFSQNIDVALSGEWTPIGNSNTYFYGNYDGNGHTIKGILISSASASYMGLFGYTSATIKNLGVDVNINSSSNHVGGLSGFNYGTIYNCYSTGSVSGYYYVGGLVGEDQGVLTNCNSAASVSGNTYVGGLIGETINSNITKCYATGSVRGSGSQIGGLAGYNYSYVNNCYALGSVVGGNCVGGLFGILFEDLNTCYATGTVSGGENVGGLIGDVVDADIINCFATGAVSGAKNIGGYIGLNNYYGRPNYCYYVDNHGTSGIGSNGGTATNCSPQTDLAFYKSLSTYTTSSNWNTSYQWDFIDKWAISSTVNNGYPNLTYSVTGVFLNKTSTSIIKGSTEKLTVKISPYNATNTSLTWSSSDSTVASVDSSGTITGNKTGTATITAKTNNENIMAACVVTVITPVSGISLDKPSITIPQGTTDALTATVLPSDASNKSITWISSDNTIATVNNGVITAIHTGTAVITATTNDGSFSTACTVVISPPLPVTGITLDKSAMTLSVGTTGTLSATILPSNAGNKSITWTSSDNTIATVNENGVVTAISEGSATITATTLDGGLSAACLVSVIQELPQSLHPYKNNTNTTWSYTLRGDNTSIGVTFSLATQVEEDYDYIYIMDGDNNQIGLYTGNELSGKTVIIPGSTVKIRLCSDRYTTDYGFDVTDIRPAIQISQDFDDLTSIPDGWISSEVTTISGTPAVWSVMDSPINPSCTPYSGSNCAMFNSYSAANGNSARINITQQNGLDISIRNKEILSFYLYEDSDYNKYNDYIQPQYSIDEGITWVNIGNPISRYNTDSGWQMHTVKLDGVIGSDVLIGLLGVSANGNNIYIDNIEFTAFLNNTYSDSELLAKDKESLAIVFSQDDSEECVTNNLILPTTGKSELTTVTWISDKQDVISNNGEIILPDNETQVTLTATITVGNEIDTKIFYVKAKPAMEVSGLTYTQNGSIITTLKRGVITCSIAVINNTSGDKTPFLVAAIFRGNKLVSTVALPEFYFLISAKSSEILELDVNVPTDCDKLKVLVFDNKENMMPLCSNIIPLLP